MSELNQINIDSNDLPTIVVTGFGLFRGYKVNPSWECVKLLKLKNANLITKQIPVAYDDVDQCVSEIWTTYKPSLVVHCGVSCMAQCITIETRAINDRSLYNKPDIYGRVPKGVNKNDSNGQNPEEWKCYEKPSHDSINSINSKINIPNVCEKVNQQFQEGLIKMPAVMSSNAGRFLCEYVYYSSLNRDSERTAFIHVPDISDNCRLEDMADALQFTIQSLIEEIRETDKSVTK